MKILFLCTGNSCRSQMAEGWARHLKGDAIEAFSAGIVPFALDPRAVRVMNEIGVDISKHRSKHLRELMDVDFDLVVTVCDHASEHCPVFPGNTAVLHKGFDDPPKLAANADSEEEALAHYRRVRDEITTFVETLTEYLGRKTGRQQTLETTTRAVGVPAIDTQSTAEGKGLGFFEKYLTVWVILCIAEGIVIGKVFPYVASVLDGLAISVKGAPVVSVPIAVCLFFMMYPIMVKIDFAEVLEAGKSVRPVGLILFINWAIKPFGMYAISLLFLGSLFHNLIGPDAVDHIKLPLGLDLPVGAAHGAGKVILVDGIRMLEVPCGGATLLAAFS